MGTESGRPSSAAQCIAAVAVAELPAGQWPELIDSLVNNVTAANSTEMLKESSLEAIGYICQDIVSRLMLFFMHSIFSLWVFFYNGKIWITSDFMYVKENLAKETTMRNTNPKLLSTKQRT